MQVGVTILTREDAVLFRDIFRDIIETERGFSAAAG